MHKESKSINLIREWKQELKDDWYQFGEKHPIVAGALQGTAYLYITNITLIFLLKSFDLHIEIVSDRTIRF